MEKLQHWKELTDVKEENPKSSNYKCKQSYIRGKKNVISNALFRTGYRNKILSFLLLYMCPVGTRRNSYLFKQFAVKNWQGSFLQGRRIKIWELKENQRREKLLTEQKRERRRRRIIPKERNKEIVVDLCPMLFVNNMSLLNKILIVYTVIGNWSLE